MLKTMSCISLRVTAKDVNKYQNFLGNTNLDVFFLQIAISLRCFQFSFLHQQINQLPKCWLVHPCSIAKSFFMSANELIVVSISRKNGIVLNQSLFSIPLQQQKRQQHNQQHQHINTLYHGKQQGSTIAIQIFK